MALGVVFCVPRVPDKYGIIAGFIRIFQIGHESIIYEI